MLFWFRASGPLLSGLLRRSLFMTGNTRRRPRSKSVGGSAGACSKGAGTQRAPRWHLSGSFLVRVRRLFSGSCACWLFCLGGEAPIGHFADLSEKRQHHIRVRFARAGHTVGDCHCRREITGQGAFDGVSSAPPRDSSGEVTNRTYRWKRRTPRYGRSRRDSGSA